MVNSRWLENFLWVRRRAPWWTKLGGEDDHLSGFSHVAASSPRSTTPNQPKSPSTSTNRGQCGTLPLGTIVARMSLNSFPQELIDEIITQLRYCRPLLMFGAIRDLRHTSLVSKKWVPQSRKLLFQEFSIFGKQLDLRGRDTPQSAAYIRHLFLWFSGWSTVPLKAIEDFLPRLKALKNIRTLIISAIDTTKLSQPNISVHFPNGLTVLDLRDCHLDVSTFVALFSSLPVVREFHARKIELSGPVVIPTKPLSGSLRVLNIDPASKTQRDMILPLFAAHPLAYQELHFAGEGAGEHIRSLITASTETLERLSLPMLTGCSYAPDTCPPPPLSKGLSFVQLMFCMASIFLGARNYANCP